MTGSDRRLVPLLLGLTLLSGVVDAISYLRLGHVFVANVTGNVVFLGFALAGAHGVDALGPLLALTAFFLGAVGGGRLARAVGAHRGRHLAWSTWLSAALVAVALAISAFAATRPLVAVLGLAMGLQSATARALAVSDITTNVVTTTVANFGAGVWGTDRPRQARRAGGVLAMFAGALVGGLLAVHLGVRSALLLALLIAIAVAAVVTRLSRRTPASDWQA